jgi:hypothetical protein
VATDSQTTHLNPSVTQMHKSNNPIDQSMRDLSIMRGIGEIVPSPKNSSIPIESIILSNKGSLSRKRSGKRVGFGGLQIKSGQM